MNLITRTLLALCVVLFCHTERLQAGEWHEVYSEKASSVVYILGVPQGRGKGGSSGTGSIIDEKGIVLTNAHVITDKKKNKPYSRLFVFLKPDRIVGKPGKDLTKQFKAEPIAINQSFDLALLKIIDPPQNLPVMKLGNPDHVVIGENVAAIGHPEQGGLWSLTTGVVSAEFEDFNKRKGWHLFQTDASLNRGNSGGPLVNRMGNLIGVNVLVARMAKDGFVITDINFSIKSTVVQKWVDEQGIRLPFEIAEKNRQGQQQPNPEQKGQEQSQEGTAGLSIPPDSKAQVKRGAKLLTKAHPYKEEEVLEWHAKLERDLEHDTQDMRSLIDRYRRK